MNADTAAPPGAATAKTGLLPGATYEQERHTLADRLVTEQKQHFTATENGDRQTMTESMAAINSLQADIKTLGLLIVEAHRVEAAAAVSCQTQTFDVVLRDVAPRLTAAVVAAGRIDTLLDELADVVGCCQRDLRSAGALLRPAQGTRKAETLANFLPAPRFIPALENRVAQLRLLPTLGTQARGHSLETQVQNWINAILDIVHRGGFDRVVATDTHGGSS